MVPAYRLWWTIRRVTRTAELSVIERIVRILTSRTTMYATFSIVVLGIAAQNIHAREYGGFVGDRPILASFVSLDEEDTAEETILGPAIPAAHASVHAASVARMNTVVLGATVIAEAPTTSAAFVQPIITDTAVADGERAGVQLYTVEEGDTLSTIAEKFGLSMQTVMWENRVGVNATLHLGNTFRILPVDGVTHTIAKGDTLESIAAKYRADAEGILEYNHLVEADDITSGDLLIIPGGRPPMVVEAPVIRKAFVLRPSLPLPSIAGKLLWPSAAGYRISQHFTWRHHGLDIAISSGTPTFASESGTVESSSWMSGYGNQVTINHGNGLRTRYGHNSRLLVTKGEHVTRGQIIALVGSTGRSTGPHIHYEVFANGVRVNPMQYLR